MNKRLIANILPLLLLICAFPAKADNVQVKARLDSVKVLMGKLTNLHLEVVQNEQTKGEFQIFAQPSQSGIVTLCGDSVELRTNFQRDTTKIGSGRIQIDYTVPVQAFDSGTYKLPAFVYISGRDTARSNELYLQVVPVPVSEDAQISDYAPVMEPEDKSIFDVLPQWMIDFWWLIAAILILIGLTLWGYKRYQDRGYILPKKPEPSPYLVAVKDLTQLKATRLWEKGLEKDYFTRLTDILRVYLDRRFDINAMEMTSDQIMQTLSANPAIKDKREYIRKILTMADYVKFAKVRPLPTDSLAAWDDAMKFVEETKPSPEEEQARLEAEKAHADALRKVKQARGKKIQAGQKKQKKQSKRKGGKS